MNFVYSRAFCALTLAVAVAISGPVMAGPAQSSAQVEDAHEPFGSRMLLPSGGAMLEKWFTMWRQWNEERRVLNDCRENAAQCADPAALELLALVDHAKTLTGLAQLGEVNRSINLAIRPVSDLMAHGVVDDWSTPLATLARRSGDCEDYAILKFVALLEAGVSPERLRIVIVRDSMQFEDHAVVAVKHETQWLLLDNRRLVMRSDAELAAYLPLLQMDALGVRRYAEVAVASNGQEPSATPVFEPSAIAW